MSAAALGFDRVVIVSSGATRQLEAEHFLRLPVDEIVRLVLAREVEFYLGTTLIRRVDALRNLRRIRQVG